MLAATWCGHLQNLHWSEKLIVQCQDVHFQPVHDAAKTYPYALVSERQLWQLLVDLIGIALFTHQLLGKLMDEFATFFFVAVWLPDVLGCHSLPLANLHSLWACPSWQLFPSQQNASMKQQHASP